MTEFTTELRRWRTARRMSQLDLSIRAGTTQRHVSFIEQGRSRPGRDMVVRLAESMELTLRERNELLLAAGFAPAFPESPLLQRRVWVCSWKRSCPPTKAPPRCSAADGRDRSTVSDRRRGPRSSEALASDSSRFRVGPRVDADRPC